MMHSSTKLLPIILLLPLLLGIFLVWLTYPTTEKATRLSMQAQKTACFGYLAGK